MATENLYLPQDPIHQYPGPPFAAQQQDAPGSIHDMDPEPDHGETSYVGSGRLAGRKAIVTGADSGIGRAVAIAFAREGADVAITFLPEEAAQGREVADLITEAGRTVAVIPGDLRDEAFNGELVEKAVQQLGGLDIIAFIAGMMPTIDSVADFDTSTFDDILKTNVYSMFWTTKAALAHLKPGASIVTTSSQQGFQASPQLVEYAVSKAGIVNWTRGMSAQLLDKGIRVNGVAPGPVWTPLQPSFVPNEKIESFGTESPMGRPGQPVELAPAYVFLASQESSYVTGETIAVTGGTPLH